MFPLKRGCTPNLGSLQIKSQKYICGDDYPNLIKKVIYQSNNFFMK